MVIYISLSYLALYSIMRCIGAMQHCLAINAIDLELFNAEFFDFTRICRLFSFSFFITVFFTTVY